MQSNQNRNQTVDRPLGRSGAQDPSVVMARDQNLERSDPYWMGTHYADNTVCSRCDAVVHHQRWTLDAERKGLLLSGGVAQEVVCPACRRIAEHVPQGIVTLRGDFWQAHREEIIRRIRNEEAESVADNPLERIAEIREDDGALCVSTTNEKLAQRIGRSLAKAYKGELQYQWSDGRKLVRVNWERNL